MASARLTMILLPPPIRLLIITIFISCLAIDAQDFTVEEATIDDIQRAFAENRLTSVQLVDFYLRRIETLNPILRGVLEINPDARERAAEADRERSDLSRLPLGPLHGVPVLLKDTIATKDKMNTTAGSHALLGSVVPRDAAVVEKLRSAGAVILGKASLTEWRKSAVSPGYSNVTFSTEWYSFRALGKIPNGWCARGGQGQNPYVPSGETCGSSSGSAISVAANMVAVSLGSETHGSILCPSDHNSVVGFKPTIGLTSRAGVIPILPQLDTVGPIARTMSDAVYLLEAIVGYDPRDDEATSEAAKYIPEGGYKQFLNQNGVKGKRLGVIRQPSTNKSIFISAFESHLNTLRERGAMIVDDLEIPDMNIISNPGKSGELTTMLAGFKISVNEYLKELVTSPVRSLADVIAFNENNPEQEKTKEYGQHTFIASETTNGMGQKERQAMELMKKLSRDGIEKTMEENKLDAIVTPGTHCISILALGGYPGITVPAGYDSNGMPFGICFGGLKGTEPKLIEIAYAFEQATLVRRPPFSRSLEMNKEFYFASA
ncbi:hypothetical protein SLE2022_200080 [Rubroshorea leprosula]